MNTNPSNCQITRSAGTIGAPYIRREIRSMVYQLAATYSGQRIA